MAASPEFDQLDRVRISAAGVGEVDEQRFAVFVPRADVLRLELARGSGAEHPIVCAVAGALFAALTLAFVTLCLRALFGGEGGRLPAAVITGIAFVIPAWWLLDLALRPRWFVRVHTRTGARKLVFHEVRDRAKAQEFVEAARRRFGYG